MGLRIEWILFILIVFVISISFVIDISGYDIDKYKKQKDLEFYDTVFSEVNQTDRISMLKTKHGVQYNNILSLQDIDYSDNAVESLVSKKAIMENDVILLEDNVSLHQRGDFVYMTQKAFYYKNKSILRVPNDFFSYRLNDTIGGTFMIYDLKTKIINADNVKAVLQMVE